MKKLTFLFFFIASSLGLTEGSLAPHLCLAESEDLAFLEKSRIQRKEREKEISLFVDAQFKSGRKESNPKKAWEIYLKIQEEIPEELVQKDTESWETARVVAWREMKGLLEVEILRFAQDDKEIEKNLAWAEPARALFTPFYEKAMEEGILDLNEILELTWLAAPYLPTKTGADWYEKISDYFFERGNLLLAHSYLNHIKEYSIGYNDRIKQKLEKIEKQAGPLLNLDSDLQSDLQKEGVKGLGGIQYQLTFQKSGLWDKELFLEISDSRFALPGFRGSDRDSSVARLPRNDIRRKIYDLERALAQTTYIKRMGDKIILVFLAEGSLLVLDFQGTLLEKRGISNETVMRYRLEKLADMLFPKEEFAWIPAGSFLMGSPASEKHRNPDNEIQHRVTLTRDFYMSKIEVTQWKWYLIMGETPSHFNKRDHCGDAFDEELKICPTHPVEQVSWHDAQRFIKKLNKIQKKYRYRLPTEAEWEYAARGLLPEEWENLIERGKSAPAYSFGNDFALISQYGWHNDVDDHLYHTKGPISMLGDVSKQTYPVALKIPNPFGLYDMHGNVWEWVEDLYDLRYGLTPDQLKAGVIDPLNNYKGYSSAHAVQRGGSSTVVCPYQTLRSAYRGALPLDEHVYSTGFRVVRELRSE